MFSKGITAAKGFTAGGMYCGVKESGNFDLGMIRCAKGATAAAVFTTNKIVSAAVEVCREHVASRKVYAVIANSGNANACTGKRGLRDAKKMCEMTAAVLGVLPEQVLVASTGIIGQHLPIRKITEGAKELSGKLKASGNAGLHFAEAIMTTDTKPKQAVRKVKISGKMVTLGGAVKGAGMIGPNMATTLCFLTTDAAISKPLLQRALREAIGNSLNKLTVDGHQSTNDTAILLASGEAQNKTIKKAKSTAFKKFTAALIDLCDDLARQMAFDAEGATRIFKVVVKGAKTREDAAKAARAVADYDLVKCAVHGGDPNWGRIICALGSCGVKLNPAKLGCKLDNLAVFRNGSPVKFDQRKAEKIVRQKEHTILVELGAGKCTDFCYGCDLSREYVTINADYHT